MNTVLDPQRPTLNPLSLGRLAQDDRGKFSRATLWRLIRRQRRWRSEGILLQETCYILDRVVLDIRMKVYEHVLPERIFTRPIPVSADEILKCGSPAASRRHHVDSHPRLPRSFPRLQTGPQRSLRILPKAYHAHIYARK